MLGVLVCAVWSACIWHPDVAQLNAIGNELVSTPQRRLGQRLDTFLQAYHFILICNVAHFGNPKIKRQRPTNSDLTPSA